MKRITLLLLLSILLIGCAAPNQLPTATATATLTPAPTSTPTLTPTATLTPTPTKDPSAPDEFTRFKSGVYYQDVQTTNGNTLTYMWDKERRVWERQLFSGYLMDIPKVQNDKGAKDQLLITVFVDATIEDEQLLPTLTHPENLAAEENMSNITWNMFFTSILIDAMADRGMFGDPKPTSISWTPWYDNSHQFHFDFFNADGPQQWGLWEGTTITVHIRGDYEQLKADTNTNGFSQTHSLILGQGSGAYYPYGPPTNYMVKIWTDADRNLYCDIAPSLRPATRWTEKQLLEMIFLGPANAMNAEDLTHPFPGDVFTTNHDSYPYFTFGPSP